MYLRVISCHGQISFGKINPLADISQRCIGIEARVELEQHVRATFIPSGPHLLDALDRLEFLLHGSNQQSLGVLGRDPFMTHRHVNDRNVDVRLGLLGNILISDRPGDQDEQQNGQDRSRITKSGADDRHRRQQALLHTATYGDPLSR